MKRRDFYNYPRPLPEAPLSIIKSLEPGTTYSFKSISKDFSTVHVLYNQQCRKHRPFKFFKMNKKTQWTITPDWRDGSLRSEFGSPAPMWKPGNDVIHLESQQQGYWGRKVPQVCWSVKSLSCRVSKRLSQNTRWRTGEGRHLTSTSCLYINPHTSACVPPSPPMNTCTTHTCTETATVLYWKTKAHN